MERYGDMTSWKLVGLRTSSVVRWTSGTTVLFFFFFLQEDNDYLQDQRGSSEYGCLPSVPSGAVSPPPPRLSVRPSVRPSLETAENEQSFVTGHPESQWTPERWRTFIGKRVREDL
ncbi:unnamed protein product [Gadus morhua 'NCC']